jgi:hypothetical protein
MAILTHHAAVMSLHHKIHLVSELLLHEELLLLVINPLLFKDFHFSRIHSVNVSVDIGELVALIIHVVREVLLIIDTFVRLTRDVRKLDRVCIVVKNLHFCKFFCTPFRDIA